VPTVSRPRRVLAIVRYTWSGAWRQWLLFAPPALLVLLSALQLPRILNVASQFQGGTTERWNAIAAHAALVEALYANCTVIGTIFAIVLGVSLTGRRGIRHQIAPILARPLSRWEFVLGRWLGRGLVLVVFWLIPMAGIEAVRIVVESPIGLNPMAFGAPLALGLLVLAGSMAMGAVLGAIPGGFTALASFWAITLLHGCPARWILPPLADLLQASTPFAAAGPPTVLVALLFQAATWTGIFCAVTAWLLERADFGSRSW
jgi:hypothetical protein